MQGCGAGGSPGARARANSIFRLGIHTFLQGEALTPDLRTSGQNTMKKFAVLFVFALLATGCENSTEPDNPRGNAPVIA
ncbi:MAG: hypothetical protein H6Q29_1019, partial [Bacteroidetes bacterium]|nr:hypothetical protein [Bacteroidota bacterium]